MTTPDQLTRQDLARMTPEQIVAAKAAGRLDRLMSGADTPPRRVSMGQYVAATADLGAVETDALLARLNLAH